MHVSLMADFPRAPFMQIRQQRLKRGAEFIATIRRLSLVYQIKMS